MESTYKQNFVLPAVMLLGLSMQTVAAKDVNRQEVARLLKEEQTAIAQNRFDDTIAKCQAGLYKLGDADIRAKVGDDTGLRVIAADALRCEGKGGDRIFNVLPNAG